MCSELLGSRTGSQCRSLLPDTFPAALRTDIMVNRGRPDLRGRRPRGEALGKKRDLDTPLGRFAATIADRSNTDRADRSVKSAIKRGAEIVEVMKGTSTKVTESARAHRKKRTG